MVEVISKNKFLVEQVFFTPEFQFEVSEIFRMLKDQENKIFDLTFYDGGANVMDYVISKVKSGGVFVVKYNSDVAAFFILENPRTFGDIITRADIHTAVRRKFWGRTSREIMNCFKEYLFSHYRIKKVVASVPQCGYGVIKLLKDLGFKHEGTLKEALIFKDKNNNPKYYDELIYSLTMEEI